MLRCSLSGVFCHVYVHRLNSQMFIVNKFQAQRFDFQKGHVTLHVRCVRCYSLATLCLNGTLSCVDFVDVITGDIRRNHGQTVTFHLIFFFFFIVTFHLCDRCMDV